MSRRLLRRKVVVPPAFQGALERPGLLRTIEGAVGGGRHLALIGRAGCGKTTVLADWCRDRPAAWLALDPEDVDLDAFLSYLAFALENAITGFRTEAWDLIEQVRDRAGAIAALSTLLADLDEQVESGPGGTPIALVLDDYHLARSPSLDALVVRLLKYLPPSVRLVLSSRRPPDIELVAWQARRELELLGEAELAFTRDEVAGLRPDLDGAGVDALLLASQGWPVAFGLTDGMLESFIEEQVLGELSPGDEGFMLRASLLGSFDVAACEEALGQELSGDRRERLLRHRLIVRAEDGGFEVPRPLRDLLRRRVSEELPREERREVLCRAAVHLWTTGQEATALRDFLEAGDREAAAARIEEAADGWLRQGRLEALDSALGLIGTDRPGLLLAQGEVARRWGQFERAHGCFEEALGKYQVQGDAIGVARARLSQAQALATRGAVAQANHLLAQCREALADDPARTADIRNLEGGLALLDGDVRKALACFEDSRHLGSRMADPYGEARAAHNLGVCHTRLGDFPRALKCYDDALSGTRQGAAPLVWMTPINRGLVLIYLGRWAEAQEAAEAALAMVRRFHLAREEGYALRTLGFARMKLADYLGAATCYEAAEDLARKTSDSLSLAYSLNFRADLATSVGSHVEALRLSDEAMVLAGGEAALGRTPEFAHVRAKVLVGTGRETEALPLLGAIVELARGAGYRYMELEAASLLDQISRKESAVAPDPAGSALAGVEGAPAGSPSTPAANVPDLGIRCFGGLRVQRGAQEVGDREWQSARAKLLLAFLLHQPEGATKARLFEALYESEATTEASLHMNLMRLRKALEPGLEKGCPSRFILRQEGLYRFNRQARVNVDTWVFEALARSPAADAGALRQALALYSGDFLAGYDADWVEALRQRYCRMALDVCRRLLERTDEGEEAIGLCYRALEIDPLAEEFHRELLLRFIEQAEPHRALDHYRLCERRFEQMLGIAPPEDLTDLVRGLEATK